MNEVKPFLNDQTTTTTTSNNNNNNDLSSSSSSSRISKRRRRRKSSTTITSSLRWMTNVASFVSALLFSGIIFGWAPLELMLVREGQYNEYCADQEEELCPEQSIRLQGIFTFAQFLFGIFSLPIGYLMDRIPKGLYFVLTAIVQVSGLLIFAASDSRTNDYFMVGYGLMAVGGCMTMLGWLPASFLLPKFQLGILALNSCLFDASSVVFFVFHRLNLIGFSRKMLFALLGFIGVALYQTLATCWFLLERKNWKDVLAKEQEQEKKAEENNNDLHTATDGDHNNSGDDNAPSESIIGLPIREQLQTSEFVLVVSFVSVHALRSNYYIMTAADFLHYSLNDVDGYYANIFGYVLPAGVVFAPLIEQTLIRLGILQTMQLTNILGLVFGILVLIPSLKLQIVTFAFFTCFRAYLYSSVNAFIASYFGVETTGQVTGFTYTVFSIVSLLQYPAAYYSGAGGRNNNDNWLYINIILLGICILPILHVCWFSTNKNSKQKRNNNNSNSLTTTVDPIINVTDNDGININWLRVNEILQGICYLPILQLMWFYNYSEHKNKESPDTINPILAKL